MVLWWLSFVAGRCVPMNWVDDIKRGVWNAIPSVLVVAVMSQRFQCVFAAWSFETVRRYLDLAYFWYVSTVWCMQWFQQGWSAFMAYDDMWFW